MGESTDSELGRNATGPAEEERGHVSEGERKPPEITRDDRFRFLGSEFRDSIEALRDTHRELTPAASKLDSITRALVDLPEKVRSFSSQERQALVDVFTNVPGEGLTHSQVFDGLWNAVGRADGGPEFVVQFFRKTMRPKREPIFHNAILTSAVAAFESHLGKLAEQYYRAAPEALHKVPKEAVKEFSLRELQALGSIDDAIEVVIDRRVSSLMFGSLSDWKAFFDDRMNIDLAELSGDWKAVLEIFERRHCVVHNEGRASSRYTRAFPDVALKEELSVDAAYVDTAIETIELLGVVLHTVVWNKFALDKQNVIDATEVIAFESLKDQRWAFSRRLYGVWGELPLREMSRRMAQVNVWIADKNLKGVAAIQKEVESWDVSGSDEIFGFAKLCLLDDLDAAFAALPTLIDHEKIGGASLATWPLLAPLREDSRIDAYADIMRSDLASSSGANDREREVISGSDSGRGEEGAISSEADRHVSELGVSNLTAETDASESDATSSESEGDQEERNRAING